MAIGHVNTTNWLLDWRDLQTFPRCAAVNDLASEPRHSRAL